MILIDDPYVSEFLKDSIRNHGLPVIKTDVAQAHGFHDGPHVIDEQDAIERARAAEAPITDSTSGFLSGSLYFNVQPNRDSLAPAIDFFREDIVHLINTFEWD